MEVDTVLESLPAFLKILPTVLSVFNFDNIKSLNGSIKDPFCKILN